MARIKHVPVVTIAPTAKKGKKTRSTPSPNKTPPKNTSSSTSPTSSTSSSSEILADGSNFAQLEAKWHRAASKHDRLMQLPPENYSYVNGKGEFRQMDDRFDMLAQRARVQKQTGTHPKVTAARQNHTLTQALEHYYSGQLQGQHKGKKIWTEVPIAGFCREDSFHARPSIKLTVPDHLKALLVDDWENVTKSQQLVPLPHPHPVEGILKDYLSYERRHREEGSAAMDVLEETVAGLREYFDKCLGRILLYKFERHQYLEMCELWAAAEPDKKHKSPIDTYGPEHLCRLIVNLPELVAQTNMDQQSVNRLREELLKFTAWLGKHSTKYFVAEYETPSQEYIDKARSS